MDVDELRTEFRRRFACAAKYAARCPGRVNLIGEHIDYSGYGVLPMAISASTYILVAERDAHEIAFFNTDPAYREHIYKFDENWIGSKKPEWFHYFLCGWKGVLEQLGISPKGMNVLLSGTIPPCAGLSSSSSIVCAAALVTLALYTGKTFELIDKLLGFAEMCAKVERYVGMEGGGMDQAIEVLANEGSAMRIDFEPLRCTPVILPDNAFIAVLHSGVTLNKAATSHYNERVVECRLAAQVIAKARGIEDWNVIQTLGELAHRLHKSAQEMIAIVEEILEAPFYTKENALSLLGITDDDFERSILTANTQKMKIFKLAQRARHVYAEADRVRLFHEACQIGNVEEMGKLMNDSHTSCRDLYECSCDKLDEVVERCLSNGALGARLTGAGWGGCAVALFNRKLSDLEVLFWSRPADGIQLIECQ